MSDILEIRDLRKNYETFSLKGVSFSLPKGYIMGFIGPNGAGKTTTIKSALNMINIDGGEIKLFGIDHRDARAVMQRIGVVMDLPFYVDDWKGKDVEKALSPFYDNWSSETYHAMLRRFQIDANKKVRDLSRGMKVKLMVAVALSHDAELLILDEPTSGLDPVARDEMMDILRDFMTDENKGVLFSTHITSDLDKIADYITFIREGEIVYTGEKDDLINSYRMVKGGLDDITKEEKKLILGIREHGAGFEGLIREEDIEKLSGDIVEETVNLEEIVVFLNREGR